MFLRVCTLILMAFVPILAGCDFNSDKIVFVSDRNGNDEIYVMNTDGASQKRLTSNVTMDYSPKLSRDGQKIAYVSEMGGGLQVDIMDSDGSNVVKPPANSGNMRSPHWCPQSERVSFITDMEGQVDVYVMNSDGTDMLKVTDDDLVEDLGNWSPNAEWVVYAISQGEDMGVYMRNPRGVDVIQLTQTKDSGPVWAPVGSLIAYFSEITVIDNEGKEKVDTEMRIVDMETMEVTSLVAQVHAESGISWSPDGKKITYVADVNGNKEVFVMEEDGSNQIQLTRNHLDDIFPVWSGDGNQIVFVSELHGNAEIIVMDVDGKKQRRLTNNRAKDISPNW